MTVNEAGEATRPTRLPRPAPSVALINRLRAMGLGIPYGSQIRRTNAGRVQKQAGAFSWVLVGPDGEDLRLGGYVPVKELLRGRLVVSRAFGGYDRTVDLHTDVPYTGRDAEYLVEPEG